MEVKIRQSSREILMGKMFIGAPMEESSRAMQEQKKAEQVQLYERKCLLGWVYKHDLKILQEEKEEEDAKSGGEMRNWGM